VDFVIVNKSEYFLTYGTIPTGDTMINVRALAISLAVLWGSAMMLMGWTASYGWGEEVVTIIGSVYIGYHPGFFGGIVGGLWGALDGALGGFVFGWLYNWVAKKF